MRCYDNILNDSCIHHITNYEIVGWFKDCVREDMKIIWKENRDKLIWYDHILRSTGLAWLQFGLQQVDCSQDLKTASG